MSKQRDIWDQVYQDNNYKEKNVYIIEIDIHQNVRIKIIVAKYSYY